MNPFKTSLLLFALHLSCAGVSAQDGPKSSPGGETALLIQQAGNTDDDRVRQDALTQLAALQPDAKPFAEFVRRWNEGGLKAYYAQVKGKPPRALGDYDFGIGADSPLQPVAELLYPCH